MSKNNPFLSWLDGEKGFGLSTELHDVKPAKAAKKPTEPNKLSPLQKGFAASSWS